MVVLTLKVDRIISLYPFVLGLGAMTTVRSFMRLCSWPEKWRRKVLLGRYRPNIGPIGRMGKVMSKLRSHCFFVDILITWSLGSLQISLQSVTLTSIVLLVVPLSLMLKVLMLVYSLGSCIMLNSPFRPPKHKVLLASTFVVLVYVPMILLCSPFVFRLDALALSQAILYKLRARKSRPFWRLLLKNLP